MDPGQLGKLIHDAEQGEARQRARANCGFWATWRSEGSQEGTVQDTPVDEQPPGAAHHNRPGAKTF